MPIYFQKIPEKKFDPDKSFYVKDSRGCNMTTGFLFLAAFAAIVYVDRFNFNEFSIYQLLYLAIVPAVYLFRRSIINKTIITINKTWFYYFEELVTNWHNFIDAVITQDEENRRVPYDLTDRFMLVLRYGKIGHQGFFGRKFIMTAVMDKSEEEIMAAIKFYYQHREDEMMMPYITDDTMPSEETKRSTYQLPEPTEQGKTE